jgi:hypothetical protein
MSAITLRQAVEVLHRDGDPLDISSGRVLGALKSGSIQSWGLEIEVSATQELREAPNKKIDEVCWSYLGSYNWQESSIKPSRDFHNYQSEWNWHATSRIVLDLDDFNRVFFPQRPFLKAATFLKEAARLPGRQTNAITLRQAVELLHKDGDPIDVAVIRIRRAAAARKIYSRGLLIGQDCGPWPDWFEEEDTPNQWWWNYAERIDWEHSAIELSEAQQYCEETGYRFMYFSRVTLDRDDFDRVFFPDRAVAEPVEIEQPPPMPLAEVKAFLMSLYGGKPYPGVKEVERAAKQYDSRITRKMIEMTEPEIWPEGRPKPGRRTGTIMSRK